MLLLVVPHIKNYVNNKLTVTKYSAEITKNNGFKTKFETGIAFSSIVVH